MNIILLHRDLRMHDNPALFHGTNAEEALVVFVYDKNYWQANGKSAFQLKFAMDCLREVSDNLKNKNIPLHIFEGDYEELKNWIEINFPNSVIYMNHFTDIDYYRTRTNGFKRFYADQKRIKIFENFGIQTKNFNRDAWSFDWQKIMTKPILSEVKASAPWGLKDIKLNSFEEFSSKITLIDQMPESQIGGETKAFELMHSFLEERGNGYAFKMSSPVEAEFACSRLSTHIAFGSISLKTVYQSLLEAIPNSSFKKDLYSFKKRLHWHCHFIQKLETEPELEFSSMHPMCDKLRGDGDNEIIEKWIKGETGFPFLDACMQFLKKKGWINFRMRAMIMSFASYNLWQPWQKTSPLLAQLFVDYEPGIHICQVQMQSGVTGINLPRIYSVIKQSKDQDPDASWIKSQLPQLREFSANSIHNAELAETYKEIICDPKASAKKARETIWSMRANKNFKKIAKDVYLKHGSRMKRRA